MYPLFKHVAVPQQSSEARQIRLFRASTYAPRGSGCPIGIQQIHKFKVSPQHRPNYREQSCETMTPRTQMGKIAQQQMHQQPHPHLPTHRIGAMSQEIRQLQGLFDLFEKHFNIPTTTVKLRHRPCTPCQVVCQKHRDAEKSMGIQTGSSCQDSGRADTRTSAPMVCQIPVSPTTQAMPRAIFHHSTP